MVFNGFPHDGIAVPLGPLWFLPHPLRVLLPRKMFLVQRSKHCRPHCRHLWIVVACNTSNMNQQRKSMVLMVIHGNVFLGCPPTCSTLRCVKLFVRGLCKPVPMTPTIMQVFWYLQGSLQDSFFANVFRRFSVRCSIFLISNWISMCCEAPFRLAASLYGHYVLCKPHSKRHGSSVVLTRTCSNTPNSEFINMNRVYNGCQTHITHHLQGNPCFPWSSWVFMCFPNDGIAVPLGPLWFLPSWRRSWCNGVNMVILTVGGLVSNTSDVNEWQTRDACGNQR